MFDLEGLMDSEVRKQGFTATLQYNEEPKNWFIKHKQISCNSQITKYIQ